MEDESQSLICSVQATPLKLAFTVSARTRSKVIVIDPFEAQISVKVNPRSPRADNLELITLNMTTFEEAEDIDPLDQYPKTELFLHKGVDLAETLDES